MGEIKKQSISNTILSYVGTAIGFVSLIYIQPHFLGSKNIGLLKLINSFSWVVAMIMPLGMGNVTMRFFPRFKNDQNHHNGYFGLLFLMISLGAALVFLLFVLFRHQFQSFYSDSPEFSEYYYYCFAFAYVFSMISVFNLYSFALMKTAFTVFLTDIYARLALIAIVFLFYFNLIGDFGLVISYFVTFLLQLIFLVIHLYRLRAVSFKINWQFYKALDRRTIFWFALVMTFTSFASLGIKYIDGLMLGHYIDLKLIGIYSVCAFIPAVLEIPFNSLERIAQARIANAWHTDNTSEISKIYEMSSRYLYYIGSVLFCCLYAGADFIFMILPKEYAVGKPVLLIIAACSLFNLLTGVNTTVISLSKHYIVTSVLLIVLILVGVVANLLLIPVFGIEGAAIATFIAIGLFNLLKYLFILLRFKMQPFSRHTGYITVCLLLSILIIYIIPGSWHPVLRAALGGGATVILFSLMNIRFHTIHEVNKVFRRFRII